MTSFPGIPIDMAIRQILEYPDPRLRKPARKVERVDDDIRRLVADMLETMYAEKGIGLAATQIDEQLDVLVMDLSEERNEPICLINAEIIAEGGHQEHEEGCLSVPGIYARVRRAEWVKVRALNEHGEPVELEAEGLLAVCIQHEMDHLRGKVFVDYLSPLKQKMVLKKMEKRRKAVAMEN